jgi:hypothetical protein
MASATDITVSGFSGKQLEMTAPAEPPCDLMTWTTSHRTNSVGAGEVNVVRIIDVASERLVISAAYHPGRTARETLEQLLAILDSVRVAP